VLVAVGTSYVTTKTITSRSKQPYKQHVIFVLQSLISNV
jgi:hypothetical protein